VKIFKIILKFIKGFCIFIFILLIFQFALNPQYTFPESHPFQGEFIYNPYRNIDTAKWRMANFHAHAAKFLESPKKVARSALLLDTLYQYFGYKIFSISDYQSINIREKKYNWYIPVYEHGYMYYKNHQLVLNAKKVSWLDFPFPQTPSNEQFVIDRLKKDRGSIISIVHPLYRKAYSYEDIKYLSNYEILEVANHDRLFLSYYDTVLSEGHPVFLIADDDAHEMDNIKDICSSFNLINTDLVRDSVLKSLRTGRSVGVKFNISSFKTNQEKKAALLNLPGISSIAFKNDSITVRLSKDVRTIKFIGQHGREKRRSENCSTGTYLFSASDTYIRTEIEGYDGTIYLLNPFFRYNGTNMPEYVPKRNILKTWGYRSSAIVLLVSSIILWKRKLLAQWFFKRKLQVN